MFLLRLDRQGEPKTCDVKSQERKKELYIFTKKCDKNILSSKLYPESSNDEDIKCL